jgi:hypothetical protein
MRVQRACVESHVGIIDRSGGASKITAALRGAGFTLGDNTVACWVMRNAIPRAWWDTLVKLELASHAELDAAFVRRRALRAETRRLARGIGL